MPAYSQQEMPVESEMDVASSRTIDHGGMTLAFERISAGADTAPLFVGLPDDACQSPHWGYVIEGRFTVTYSDGSTEEIETGDAYYLPSGHSVRFDEDTRVLELSPSEERAHTMEHIGKVFAELQGAEA
jgi:hypothetical protein